MKWTKKDQMLLGRSLHDCSICKKDKDAIWRKRAEITSQDVTAFLKKKRALEKKILDLPEMEFGKFSKA